MYEFLKKYMKHLVFAVALALAILVAALNGAGIKFDLKAFLDNLTVASQTLGGLTGEFNQVSSEPGAETEAGAQESPPVAPAPDPVE